MTLSADGVWNPRHLLAVPHRVTFVTFGPMDSYRNVRQLHTTDVTPMAGGLFAGGTTALLRFCHLHQQVRTRAPGACTLSSPPAGKDSGTRCMYLVISTNR